MQIRLYLTYESKCGDAGSEWRPHEIKSMGVYLPANDETKTWFNYPPCASHTELRGYRAAVISAVPAE